jgi:hypothetical protein
MPRLDICDKDGKIPERPKYAVGSKCDWVVSSSSGGLTNVRWTVDGAVGSYVVEGKRGKKKPTLLKLNTFVGDKPAWYWSRVGRVTVKVSATVSGFEVDRTVVVKVEGAQRLNFTSVTDEVKVAKLNSGDDIPALTFGGVAGSAHGIKWTAKIVAPPAPGDLSFTQVMTIFREFTLEDGRTSTTTTNDEYVLDEDFHYGVAERGIETDKELETVPCLANEVLVLEEADSPSTKLPRTMTHATTVHKHIGDYKKVEVKEAFRLFLMYKPKGGVWVSLADLRWNWSGVAEYKENEWVLTSKDYSKNPSGKERVMFPLWSANRDDFM